MADAMAATPATTPPDAGGTRVDVTFDEDQPVNRLWGIPILGYLIRYLVLIPNLIVLWFGAIGLGLSLIVSWLLVLVLGRQPFASFYRWFLTYSARVLAWGFFLAAPLPPFLGEPADYPVKVSMPIDGSINRLWGIPWLGIVIRSLTLIPHFIVAAVYVLVAYVFALVLWIPILVNGRAPKFAYTVFGGLIRQQLRIYSWYLLCPVSYPPAVPTES